MRLPIIKTIYFKELREVLRDKRTLYLVILMPFFLYPILFTIVGKLGAEQAKKLDTEAVTVLLNPEAEGTPIHIALQRDTTLKIKMINFDKSMLDSLESTIGIRVVNNFDTALVAKQPVGVEIYANTTKDLLDNRKKRVVGMIEIIKQQIVAQRLEEQALEPTFLEPIQITEIDLASREAIMGKIVGRFIPMILIFFIFTGIVYIAIDITAGEKERKTLQTLFIAPIKVSEIITGKFLAVFTVGIATALMNLLSLIVAFIIQVRLLGGDVEKIGFSISPAGWMWMVVLIIFTTIFIGALTLAVVLLANSYKESQSYVTPLMLLITLPAIYAFTPGVELTFATAFIPIVNIFLAMGAIFVGNIDVLLMVIVAGMALLYALLALAFASLTFGNENVITGEKINFKQLFSNRN